MNPATVFTGPDQSLDVCPAFTGGKNWMEGAYNPKANVMYLPVQNICSVVTSEGPKTKGQIGMGINYTAVLKPGVTNIGSIYAVSAATGRTEWRFDQRAGMMSLMSTAGGLVFAGDAVGRFKAIDDASGKKLWEVNLASPVGGYPISYSVDSKQFVAVGTGFSPEASALTRETPEYKASTDNVLFAFALP
jgi:alcohol dehydrogenase (cytochrome c)